MAMRGPGRQGGCHSDRSEAKWRNLSADGNWELAIRARRARQTIHGLRLTVFGVRFAGSGHGIRGRRKRLPSPMSRAVSRKSAGLEVEGGGQMPGAKVRGIFHVGHEVQAQSLGRSQTEADVYVVLECHVDLSW